MTVEIISVGTELLLGDIVNTNAQFISRELAALGCSVYFQTTVGDNPRRLKSAYSVAFGRADVVIATGGLGPTEDDLTKEIGAEYFDRKMITDEASLAKIYGFFKSNSLPMAENNIKQAVFPEGSIILKNEKGTAPGCIIEEYADGNCSALNPVKTLIMLPGPPGEMIPMFLNEVAPYLKRRSAIGFYSTTLRVCGVGESAAEQMLKGLIDAQTNPTIAPYAKTSEVHIRVTAAAKDKSEADALSAPVLKEIRRILGDNIYAEGDVTLEENVVGLIKQRGLTVACAESCTGGLLAARLVDCPGVSECFIEGVVCYGNESKHRRLGVKKETLDTFGAVSAETAREMAAGARGFLGADIGIAITGVAGPGGGTAAKPVGLVFIALNVNGETKIKELNLKGDRERIRQRTVVSALDFLRRELLWP